MFGKLWEKCDWVHKSSVISESKMGIKLINNQFQLSGILLLSAKCGQLIICNIIESYNFRVMYYFALITHALKLRNKLWFDLNNIINDITFTIAAKEHNKKIHSQQRLG